MSNTIVIVAKGQVIDVHGDHQLDGMIEAQDEFGQITWDALSHGVSVGEFVGNDNEAAAVAVFDLDLADGMDVIRVTNWVNNGGDLPELKQV